MSQTILVPLDGSAFGEQALPMAITLSQREGGRLHLVHVHTVLEATYAELQLFDDSLDAEIRKTELGYLDKIKKRIESLTGTPVSTALVDGDICEALKREVEAAKAQLVVLSTHARGPVGRFWLGSVADELIRELPVPLVLVHPRQTPVNLQETVKLEHILVPLDEGPFSQAILSHVERLAQQFGADLTLMHVVQPIYPTALPPEPGPWGGMAVDLLDRVEKVQEHLKSESKQHLENVANQLRAKGIRTEVLVTVEESPSAAIAEHGHKPIDLIALESHGRGGLSRLLFGSTADKVIRSTTLPILIHCSKD